MRFIVDAQLPPALAHLIRSRGFEAQHVADVGLVAASDLAIWDYALRHAAVVITKDEDFPRRRATSAVGPTVDWLRLPNARRRALLNWFDSILPAVAAAVERGETVIEVRGPGWRLAAC